MENYTKEQIEAIEAEFERIVSDDLYDDEFEVSSLEDKYETIWQYYDAAGFDIKTEVIIKDKNIYDNI